MATFTLTAANTWRCQVRRKGVYVADTFIRKTDAQEWARAAEIAIDRGEKPPRRGETRAADGATTLGDLIDLHIKDMDEMRRRTPRSKDFVLRSLKRELGKTPIAKLNREQLIEYGRKRAAGGAGPATVTIDFAYLNTVITHAAAVHGVLVSPDQVKLARVALKRLGIVGKPKERDRRPTQDELDHIIAFLDGNPRQNIPAGRIVRFAVATAMRAEEICRIRWEDLDERKRTVIVRDRKDPRNKEGNDQKVPLLSATGYDAWALVQEQGHLTGQGSRIFPYRPDSLGAAFRRACTELEIKDLRFHDLRHEGTSRLFEAGLAIEQVALVTGHRDWKMLKRYTNLRPEDLHDVVVIRRDLHRDEDSEKIAVRDRAKRRRPVE
ncbi:MAG: site-specific integrase [Hyphomonadaceae bacterium]